MLSFDTICDYKINAVKFEAFQIILIEYSVTLLKTIKGCNGFCI